MCRLLCKADYFLFENIGQPVSANVSVGPPIWNDEICAYGIPRGGVSSAFDM